MQNTKLSEEGRKKAFFLMQGYFVSFFKIVKIFVFLLFFLTEPAFSQHFSAVKDQSKKTSRYIINYYAKQGNVDALKTLVDQGNSLEVLDSSGNTPLCEAVSKQNVLAIQALLLAGANNKAECMDVIPDYKKHLVRNYSKPGMSTATKVGIGVAGVALVGGGVALGLSGGGGGGKDDSSSNKFNIADYPGYSLGECPDNAECDIKLYGVNKIYKILECKDGWVGENCAEPNKCPYTTITCTGNYEETGVTCRSGNVLYKKCALKNCVGYSEKCSYGYSPIPGDTCQTNGKTLVKCQANECAGYTVGACPKNAECDFCQRGHLSAYKILKCKDGWEGSDCSVKKVCSSDYNLMTAPDSNKANYETCTIETPNKYKITSCKGNWSDTDKECRICSLTGESGSVISATCQCNTAGGYNQNGTSCVKAEPQKCSSDYNLTTPPDSNKANYETCTIETPNKYKITSCKGNWSDTDKGCNTCSLEGIGVLESSCTCDTDNGFSQAGNNCIRDFSNIATHPKNDNPEDFLTKEFLYGNFLEQIGANYAYAKGYNGYLVDRNSSGGLNSNTLTDDKIKVGIWDTAFDVDHPDLMGNIATREFNNGETKTYGYNTRLGPCRNGDKKNCYEFVEVDSDIGYVKWYDNNGMGNNLPSYLTRMDFDAEFLSYASTYNWDDENTKYHVEPSSSSVKNYSNNGDGDHGTHVTGIVGASNNSVGLHGVVPNAELYLSNWTNDNFENIDKIYAAEFFKENGVRVINASYGHSILNDDDTRNNTPTASEFLNVLSDERQKELLGYGYEQAYKMYAENDIVLVKAAGNDGNGGRYETSFDTAIPMISGFRKDQAYDLTNLFIGVVSVDKNNALASYSQYCGSTAAWCISAPGGDINKGMYIFNQVLKGSKIELDNNLYASDIQWSQNLLNQFYDEKINSDDVFREIYTHWGIMSTVENDYTHHYIKDGNSSYGTTQGTSMAAPVVTGAVALLMSAYPHLTSQEVVEILFRSANKNMHGWGSEFKSLYYDSTKKDYVITTVKDELIVDGWTDSFGNKYNLSKIYGHGMVDLNAATSPLGALKAPMTTSSSSKISIDGTKLALPKFVNSRFIQLYPEQLLGLDDYDRPFSVPLLNTVKVAYHNSDAFKRDFKSFMNRSEKQTVGIEDKLSFSFSSSKTDNDLLGMGVLDMNYKFNDSSSMKFSYRSDTLNEENYIDKALANPFINMTDSYSLNHQLKWKDVAFSFGGTIGKNAFYETDEEKDEEFKRSVHSFNSEIQYQPNRSLMFKVVGGMMQETDAVLGMNGAGVFETGNGRTYFTGATLEYSPFIPFTLSASYYYGRSSIPNTKALLRVDDLITDSFAFDARYQPDENNVFGIQFTSPLRIRTGNAIFNIPVARDLYTDNIYFNEYKVSLKPQSREYDFSLYYMKETDNLDLRGQLMLRLNPDHMSGVKPDYRALFGLSYSY